jgi:hypothetical protein
MIPPPIDLPATTDTLVFRIDRTRKVEQITVANRTAGTINVRLWGVPAQTPKTDAHAWLHDVRVNANSTIQALASPITLILGEEIWARASATGISIGMVMA